MSFAMPLNDAEIRCLEKVAAGRYTNLLRAPDEVESLILLGLVQNALVMAVPYTPNRYDYRLTTYGAKTLEALQPSKNKPRR